MSAPRFAAIPSLALGLLALGFVAVAALPSTADTYANATVAPASELTPDALLSSRKADGPSRPCHQHRHNKWPMLVTTRLQVIKARDSRSAEEGITEFAKRLAGGVPGPAQATHPFPAMDWSIASSDADGMAGIFARSIRLLI